MQIVGQNQIRKPRQKSPLLTAEIEEFLSVLLSPADSSDWLACWERWRRLERDGATWEVVAAQYERRMGLASISDKVPRRSGRRTTAGVYYTPPEVVRSMAGNALRELKQQPELPRVLDPACGAGAFLRGLLRELLAVGTTVWDALSLLHGVDVDSGAVRLARFGLLIEFGAACPDAVANSQTFQQAVEIMNRNVRHGNSLFEQIDESALSAAALTERSLLQPFDWRAEFPEIMADGGFDLVIGNPPYVDAETMTRSLPVTRGLLSERYSVTKGNWDLFCPFIERAWQLCRPGGAISLLVPNKLASANYAGECRRLLTEQADLRRIHDYSGRRLFPAGVYPLAFLAIKTLPRTVVNSQRPWPLDRAASPLPVRANSRRLAPLSELAEIYGAATVAEAYALSPWIETKGEACAGSTGTFRLVNSGTIDRYRNCWAEKPLRYLKQAFQRPIVQSEKLSAWSARRAQQAARPKLIVAGLTRRLEVFFDARGEYLAGKSTTVIFPTGVDPRYLLALLNSRLLSDWHAREFAGEQLSGGFLRVGPSQLRRLPIAICDLNIVRERALQAEIIALAEQLEATDSEAEFKSLDAQLDARVAECYGL